MISINDFPCPSQAFSIPVIQIVYETLSDQKEGKKGRAAIKTGGASEDSFISRSLEFDNNNNSQFTRNSMPYILTVIYSDLILLNIEPAFWLTVTSQSSQLLWGNYSSSVYV